MSVEDMEDVESFRARARAWLQSEVPRIESPRAGGRRGTSSDEEELATITRCRELQRLYFDAGFAGVCVPTEYGGQGLTFAHQLALNQEIVGYQSADATQVPTFTPCMAVILEFGTEAQKRAHVPAILKGEEMWMQFLSEPSGGSDAAGALTTAVRDGEEWVLNGSKIWTTGAWWADWGLCLARTNWDVPKHRGLSVFLVKIHQPGIDIHRIEMLNGSREFCQEFLTDVRVPDTDRVGEVDQGWTVGVRWMYHERTVYGGSPYVTRPAAGASQAGPSASSRLFHLAQTTGKAADPRTRDLIGEARSLELVSEHLVRRIAGGIRSGAFSDQAAAILRLSSGTTSVRLASLAFELARAGAVAWEPGDDALADAGIGFLMRQSSCIGGGTTEMSRNVISERVLGMPRERSMDRDVAFRDVPRSAS